MSKVLQNNKATISLGRVELFCLFVFTCSYTVVEATVLSCRFSRVWSGMPKVLWSNKSPISLKMVVWFCWFFASSYLHLVRYPLKLQKYAFWTGIFRHSLSANQIVRCFKLKNLKNNLRYQVDFLLPLKLEKILCYFGLWPQNTLSESVCGIFTFDLFDLLNLIPGVHCYIALVFIVVVCWWFMVV